MEELTSESSFVLVESIYEAIICAFTLDEKGLRGVSTPPIDVPKSRPDLDDGNMEGRDHR